MRVGTFVPVPLARPLPVGVFVLFALLTGRRRRGRTPDRPDTAIPTS